RTVTTNAATTAPNAPAARASRSGYPASWPTTDSATAATRTARPRWVSRTSDSCRARGGHRDRGEDLVDDVRRPPLVQLRVRGEDQPVVQDRVRHVLDVVDGHEPTPVRGREGLSGTDQGDAAAWAGAVAEVTVLTGGRRDRGRVLDDRHVDAGRAHLGHG